MVVAENLRGRMVTVLKIQLLLNTLQSSSDELKPNQKSDANRRHTYKNMTLSRGGDYEAMEGREPTIEIYYSSR